MQTATIRTMNDTREAAAYLGLEASTLEKLRMTGDGPVYLKIGRRCLYAQTDLDVWLSKHRRTSTTCTA